MTRNETGWPWRWLPAFIILVSLFVILTAFLGYALNYHHILTWDEWDVYSTRIIPYRDTPLPFSDMSFWLRIWGSRFGHRQFFPAVFEKVNLLWFAGDMGNLVFLNVLSQVIAAWALSRSAVRALPRKGSRFALLFLAMALLLCLGHWPAFVWGAALSDTLVVLGVCLACYGLYQCGENRGSWHAFWFFFSLAGGVLASASYGAGIVVWPALVLMGLGLRLPRRTMALLVVSGVAVIVAYFFPTPADWSGHITWPTSPVALFGAFNRALGMLGNMPAHWLSPYGSRQDAWLSIFARAVGLVGVILTAILVLVWQRRPQQRPWLALPVGVALYVLGTAAVIGIARHDPDLGSYGMLRRYRIISALLWTALLCGFSPLLSGRLKGLWPRAAGAVAMLVFFALLLQIQSRGFLHSASGGTGVEKSALALVNKVNDKGRMHHISRHGVAYEFAPYLRRHHLSIFRKPWTHWIGTRLPGAGKPVSRVPGGIAKAKSFPSGWRVTGWTERPYRGDLVVGVSQKGVIRSIAQFIAPPRYAIRHAPPYQSAWLSALHHIHPWLPLILGWGRSWFGYSRTEYDPNKLRYFVVTPDKRIVGRLVRAKDQ